MIENEYRVRPVTRYNLTHYECTPNSGSCQTVAEFDSIDRAEQVGRAMRDANPGSTFITLLGREPLSSEPKTGEYVIVAVHTYQVDTKAYFAQSFSEAQSLKSKAEAEHGTEFRVFAR